MKKIIIAGGTGFLGTIITDFYTQKGYKIVILTRKNRINESNVQYVKWDAKTQGYWTTKLEGAEMLINLNGKSVDCRYNDKNKELIYDTRIQSTWTLQKAMEQLKNPPKLWINASSATIYRHSLDQPMTEQKGELGIGFSVDVVKKWESAFFENELPKTRKVALRIAIVLGKNGGALQPLLGLSKIGMGGKQGKGNQMFSWIHEIDFVNIVDFVKQNENLEGIINVSSPHPLSNKSVMQKIRKAIGRPFGIPMPKWLLEIGARIIKTETELIVKSRYVLPERLLQQHYKFKFSDFDTAIEHLVGE